MRKRRPLNGVVLTISAQDLLLRVTPAGSTRRCGPPASERAHARSIQLPVYVMVAKCDMVAGFNDYLSQAERAQVWGITFRTRSR